MDDVLRWLQSVGLAQYAPDFAAHGISLSDLPELSEADLRELGLPIGARKQIRRALRTRGARRAPSAARCRCCSSTWSVPPASRSCWSLRT
ncbi:SAM domain-containing protein [Roseomonas gilardii subsp. gilardii]|uniref:SAM domain-containing protein n=1 Tax=Roseomonas gilardii TaxID=257708 RepID=UPI001FFB010C|nr:SAM domain-containing protein [Roseomonas gilardii]UPG73909.1 SAM domain-containing protein [Roseomonas gilardii subsp. gilardii]